MDDEEKDLAKRFSDMDDQRNLNAVQAKKKTKEQMDEERRQRALRDHSG